VLIFAAPALVAFKPTCIKPDEPNGSVIKNPRAKPDDPNAVPPQKPKPWLWLGYIDIAEQLKQGLVVVLMYHHDCSTCATMVPKYDRYFRKMKEAGDDSMKIAFLAIPPYSEKGLVPTDTLCLRGKLSDKQKWAITSPYVVALIDGEVVKTWKQGTAPEPEKIMDEIFAQP
jgi:hypothetical protein